LFCLWRLHRGPNRPFFPDNCCSRRQRETPWSEKSKNVQGFRQSIQHRIGGVGKVYLTDLKRQGLAKTGTEQIDTALSPLPPKIAAPSSSHISSSLTTPSRGILKKTNSPSPIKPTVSSPIVSQPLKPLRPPHELVINSKKDSNRDTGSSFGNIEGLSEPPVSVIQPQTAYIPTLRPFPVRQRDLRYKTGPAYPPVEPPNPRSPSLAAGSTEAQAVFLPSVSHRDDRHFTSITASPVPIGKGSATPIAAKSAKLAVPVDTAKSPLRTALSPLDQASGPAIPSPLSSYSISPPILAPSPSFPFPVIRESPIQLQRPAVGEIPRSTALVRYDVSRIPTDIAQRHRLIPLAGQFGHG